MIKKSKKTKYIVLIVILVLIMVFGYSAYAVNWTGGYKVPAAEPSTQMLEKIRAAQSNGGTLEIRDSEINSFIKSFLNKSISKGKITVEGIGVNLIGDKMIIKVPVIYRGVKILLSCSTGIALENDKLVLKPLSFKVGKMPVPTFLVLGKIKDNTSEGIKVNTNSIEINKDIIPFPVKTFTVKDSKLVMNIPSPIELAKEAGGLAQQSSATQVTGTPLPADKIGVGNGTSGINGNTSQKNTPAKAAAADPKVEASLKNVKGDLSAVSASVATSDEKAIISQIGATINKIIADPNYTYTGDVNFVKSKYKSLSAESKNRIKSAIMNKMNVSEIMRLVFMFGM